MAPRGGHFGENGNVEEDVSGFGGGGGGGDGGGGGGVGRSDSREEEEANARRARYLMVGAGRACMGLATSCKHARQLREGPANMNSERTSWKEVKRPPTRVDALKRRGGGAETVQNSQRSTCSRRAAQKEREKICSPSECPLTPCSARFAERPPRVPLTIIRRSRTAKSKH